MLSRISPSPLSESKILECKPLWSASPTASSTGAEHSRFTMNNGWLIGLISWGTNACVSSRLRSSGSTRDGERWKMPLAYPNNFTLGCKKKFNFCFEVLNSGGQPPLADWVMSGKQGFQEAFPWQCSRFTGTRTWPTSHSPTRFTWWWDRYSSPF